MCSINTFWPEANWYFAIYWLGDSFLLGFTMKTSRERTIQPFYELEVGITRISALYAPCAAIFMFPQALWQECCVAVHTHTINAWAISLVTASAGSDRKVSSRSGRAGPWYVQVHWTTAAMCSTAAIPYQLNQQLMNVSLRDTDVHHQGRASWELWHHDVVTVRTRIEPANQNTYLKVLAVTSDPSFETASQTWRRHHIMINPLCLIKYISTFICSKTGKAIIVGVSECRRTFTKGS